MITCHGSGLAALRPEMLRRLHSHLLPASATAAPAVVVIFSGKRKAGKDFVCEQLLERCATCQLLACLLGADAGAAA